MPQTMRVIYHETYHATCRTCGMAETFYNERTREQWTEDHEAEHDREGVHPVHVEEIRHDGAPSRYVAVCDYDGCGWSSVDLGTGALARKYARWHNGLEGAA